MTEPSPVPTVRKLGPGVLSIGSAGSPVDFAPRCTAAKVVWSVKAEDSVPVLSGGTESGDRTYTATLEITVYQDDLTEGGLVDFSWANKGAQLPWTFTPYNGGRSITGELILDPMDVGGEVGKKNTSDLKLACVGDPELADDLS